jgi:hypothetical protein
VEIALDVLKTLDIVGVLCVEFFLTKKGRLLINELAPRPHNSGHLTLDASVTNQFEQQLRAVCGLPLGATDFFAPAAMANLLGDVWAGGEPVWARALAFPDVKLHLYGKADGDDEPEDDADKAVASDDLSKSAEPAPDMDELIRRAVADAVRPFEGLLNKSAPVAPATRAPNLRALDKDADASLSKADEHAELRKAAESDGPDAVRASIKLAFTNPSII